MEAVLEAKELSKIYGQRDLAVRALKGVSLTLKRGEFLGLMGPSGSGKSTLLNILGLCDAPTSGALFLNGSQVQFGSESALRIARLNSIGFIFQQHNLISHLSARENVALPLILKGVSYNQALKLADSSLAKLGLGQRGRHLPSQLSGGEAQRVGIARALIHNPQLILADEPTGSLDSSNGLIVLEGLRAAAQTGVAILMATHSDQARAACDSVLRISDGTIAPESRASRTEQ